MNLSINVLVVVACIAVFAYRAYRRGIWQGLLGLLGIIFAYVVGILVAPWLTAMALPHGVAGVLAMAVAVVALFFLVSSATSFIPLWFFPKLKKVTPKQRKWGALLGACSGSLFAIIAVWMLALLNQGLSENSEPDWIARTSAQVVSTAVERAAKLIQEDELKAKTIAVMVSEPKVVSDALNSLAESGSLQRVLQDGDAQFYMAESDIEALVQTAAFRDLVSEPDMKMLIEKMVPEAANPRDSEFYVAENMSMVWRKMRRLRSDARVVAILEDPEVRALVQQQDTLGLLAQPKIHQLIDLVMSEEDVPVTAETAASAPLASPPERQQNQALYKWLDDTGQWRYTDFNNMPREKRATAERLTH